MGNRVSLRQVATEAGVSVSTASLALAGNVRIPPTTAARVRTAATALGYVRDLTQSANAANRFRHGGKPALIVTWTDSTRSIERLQHYAAGMGMSIHQFAQQSQVATAVPVARGAKGAASRRSAGTRKAEAATPEAANPPPALPTRAQLAHLGAAALIVQCRGIDTRQLAELGVPVVLWSDEGDGPLPCDVIETCEWWTASAQTCARVRDAGYRRPVAVLVTASPPHWHDHVRDAAFRAQGIPVLTWDVNDASLRRFVQRHRADAVIGLHVHVLRALERMELVLPFAALLTFDLPWHRHCAGWREDADRQARMTLELIEQRLRYGERPPCRIVVPPLWHAGKSLPLANRATNAAE